MGSSNQKQLNVGLIGFGNVGQGVLNILAQNNQSISNRVGYQVNVKTIVVRSPEKYKNIDRGDAKLTTDVNDILNDSEIDIVVEVMGGEMPAFDYICEAIKRKKHVVTANKEVISKHKKTFFELAKEYGVDVYFEASVGGGIPIIRSFKVGYSANQIEAVFGILNGTSNFILTKIKEEHQEFETALKEAQRLGFAEADPTMDINGIDAAYKLVILAAVAFKIDIQLKDIYYEGIEKITLKDVKYAEEFGYTIKLLASGKVMKDGRMLFKVHPCMIDQKHPLAAVRNEFNAVYSVGNAMGEAMIYGKGAGSFPTGSAVVSDILDIAFDAYQAEGPVSRRNLENKFGEVNLMPIKEALSQFYIRVLLTDHYGVLEKVMHVFSTNRISVLKVIQKEVSQGNAEMVIITHQVKEEDMENTKIALTKLSDVKEIQSVIRVGINDGREEGILGI